MQARITRAERRITKQRLSEIEKWSRFKTCGDQKLETALEETYWFIYDVGGETERNPKCGRWLSLVGPAGTGKTHLARRIWEWWKNTGKWYEVDGPSGVANCVRDGRFISWPATCEGFMRGEYGVIQDLTTEFLLVIDDIGAEHDRTGVCANALCRILDARLKLWTVITSNLSMREIGEKMDTRIASRMMRGESVVVGVDTKDYSLR